MMRSKRIIPVFFILILSLFPTLSFVESAGYGEENENLGQFTDDYENDDNVSVAVEVINNQTLDCMELNYTAGGGYEDFTTYTEFEEAGNRIRFNTDYNVSLDFIRNVDSRLYKDFGVGFFDVFEYEYEFHYNTTMFENAAKIWFLVSNATTNPYAQYLNNDRYLSISMSRYAGDRKIDVIEGKSDGGQNFITSNTLADNTWYYCYFGHNATHFWLNIYTNAARTVLFQKLQLALVEASANYRYLMIASLDSGHAQTGRGEIRNVLIDSIGGYAPEGYFTTEDYLNYTTGQGLALLTNASIPYGTSMTVQFSNDNATWFDNEGNIGSTTVLDGFYAIDLRDLNYTDSFKMFNLTTIDISITPRLYQAREVTTNGTAGTGIGPSIEDDYFWVFIAIALSMIVGIIVWLKYGNQ